MFLANWSPTVSKFLVWDAEVIRPQGGRRLAIQVLTTSAGQVLQGGISTFELSN